MAAEIKKSLFNCLNDLISIMDEINALHNAEHTLHRVVEQLVKDLNCKTCAIVQINLDTELLEIRNSQNISWTFSKNYRKQIATPIIAELIWKGQPIHISDKRYAATFADELKMEQDFNSAYAVQLIANHQPLGFLYVDSDEYNHFPTERQLIVNLYARVISLCIFLERLTAQLKKLDWQDTDSGAVRFEHYFPILQELFERSHRLKENFSVFILDIEKYSSLIKSYGVEVTTALLKDLVTLINKNLRQYDGISRFGADEFLVALPGTKKNEALEVARKIENLITKSEFTNHKLKVDVFIGVANYPDDSESINGLITAAKNALFNAKRRKNLSHIATVDEKFE